MEESMVHEVNFRESVTMLVIQAKKDSDLDSDLSAGQTREVIPSLRAYEGQDEETDALL